MANDDDKEPELGSLKYWMGRVDGRLVFIAEELKETRDGVEEYRREQSARWGEFFRRVEAIERKQADHDRRFSVVEPRTDDYWNTKAEARGMARLAGTLRVVVAACVSGGMWLGLELWKKHG